MKRILLLGLVFSLAGPLRVRGDSPQTGTQEGGIRRCAGGEPIINGVCTASIIALIANARAYDGARVRIAGVVTYRFESQGVYVSAFDYENRLTQNAVWLDASGPLEKEALRCEGKLCVLEGTFSSGRRGHFGLWSGTLDQVRLIEPRGSDGIGDKFKRLLP